MPRHGGNTTWEHCLTGHNNTQTQTLVTGDQETNTTFTNINNVNVLQEELVIFAILCQDLPSMSLSIAAHIDQANHSSFVQFCNYLLVKLSRRRTFAICEQYIYIIFYYTYYTCIYVFCFILFKCND